MDFLIRATGLYDPEFPGSVATPLEDRLRRTVHAEDFGFTPGGNATTNTAALQAAVDSAGEVLLPRSILDCNINGQIIIPARTRLIGHGPMWTSIVSTYDSGFALVHHAALEGSDALAPQFIGFRLAFAHSGIQLNDPDADFDNDDPPAPPSAQNSLMRPIVDGVNFDGPGIVGPLGVPTSVGLDLNKCFNARIVGCEIKDCNVGLRVKGSDLCSAMTNRIWKCGTLVHIRHTGTWGSSFMLLNNDLLIARDYFIRTEDWDGLILYNYLENALQNTSNTFGISALTGAVIDVVLDYRMQIVGNRIETPADICPELMRVTGEGQLFRFESNGTAGLAWGTVTWNTDNSAKYWKNTVHRQLIIQRDNSAMESFPFQSEPAGTPPRNRRRDLWLLTPSSTGLRVLTYGDDLKVRDGAFVLPAIAAFESLVRFRDENYPITATVNIYVRAKGAVSGQELDCTRYDGATPGDAETVTLTTSYAWHTLFTSASVADLELYFSNDDAANGGEALITDIVVESA